jgi:hypothetical protein
VRRAAHPHGRWIALLLAISAVSCGSPGPTPAQVRAACEKDTNAACCGIADCPVGSDCDFSFVCGQGSNHEVTCDAPTGDRQCHTRCDDAHPCAAGTCQAVTIYDGSDTGRSVAMCLGAGP